MLVNHMTLVKINFSESNERAKVSQKRERQRRSPVQGLGRGGAAEVPY